MPFLGGSVQVFHIWAEHPVLLGASLEWEAWKEALFKAAGPRLEKARGHGARMWQFTFLSPPLPLQEAGSQAAQWPSPKDNAGEKDLTY